MNMDQMKNPDFIFFKKEKEALLQYLESGQDSDLTTD